MKEYLKIALIIFLNITFLFKNTSAQVQFIKKNDFSQIYPDAEFVALEISQFGDIYLLEANNHEVNRINSAGIVLNRNGGFGWEEGQFDTPIDIAIGSGLDITIADYNNHRIVRFDRYLNYITIFPNPDSDLEILYPYSVTVSKLGDIYI